MVAGVEGGVGEEEVEEIQGGDGEGLGYWV